MGGKVSTVDIPIQEDNSRAHFATPSDIPIAFAPNFRERRPPSAATAAAAGAGDYRAPALVQPRMAEKPNGNRIMAFHSNACWSGYLESSKALTNLVVVYFTIAWYEPCRYMEPTFKNFAAKYINVEFVKIDADELYELSRYYGIQTTPTFLFIGKGKVVDKVVGTRKEELQRKIELHRV